MAVRATLVGTPGWVPTPHPRTAVGHGWSADWGSPRTPRPWSQGGLGALLIHGTTRYPQGHGAIERFHRTAYDQVLRSLDGAADVDPACAALTLRLRHFLER